MLRDLPARLIAPGLLTVASLALASGLALAQTTSPADDPASRPTASDPASVEIARRVVAASGGAVWPDGVRRLKFTFNVTAGGETKAKAAHDWDVAAGKDTVTWDGKTVTIDVTADPASFEEGTDERAAFARWTNDGYWLLAPLKLLDAGAALSPAATTRDQPPSRAMMTMSFNNVGMTPGDQYDLAVDLKTDRLTHWTYRPNPQKSVGATWDDYQDFNGLTLSTDHRFDGGDTRLFFTDVSVERR